MNIAAPTPAQLKARLQNGTALVGSPQEIVAVIRIWEQLGVDQLIFSPLTMAMDQKHVLRSIETFGTHVIPQFDKDPVHSTTRQREAALAKRSAA